jgi:uncharacterized membrane protein
MNGKRVFIFALLLFFLGQTLYYSPQLPERIASHFNFHGEPDAWMSKSGFFTFQFGLLAFVCGLFFCISYFLPKMPRSLINLPNKDYWLAPERRAETFRVLRDKIETFQIPLLILFVILNQLTIRANLTGENLSSASWLVLGAFLLYTIVWAFGLNKNFKIYENRTS